MSDARSRVKRLQGGHGDERPPVCTCCNGTGVRDVERERADAEKVDRELRAMLAGIAERREQTSPEALAAWSNGRRGGNGESLGGNGNSGHPS